MSHLVTSEDRQAEEFVSGLLGERTTFYPDKISYSVFCKVYALLPGLIDDPFVRVLISAGQVQGQFPGVSSNRFLISGQRRLTKEDFAFIPTDSREVYEVPPFSEHWLVSVKNDLVDRPGWALTIFALSTILCWFQSTGDMHQFYSIAAQVLALVLTLYGLFRYASVAMERMDLDLFLSGYTNRVICRDSAVSTTAILSVFICLMGILITTPSFASIASGFAGAAVARRILITMVGVVLAELVFLVLYALVSYYPERRRQEASILASEMWFARKRKDLIESRVEKVPEIVKQRTE